MNLEFAVWYNDHFHQLRNKEWVSKWKMAKVKTIHLGTNKVIISCKNGNRSVVIDNECILRQYINVRDDDNLKLYTGDIVVMYNTLTELSVPYKAIIEWDKYRFAFRSLEKVDYISNFPMMNADPFCMSIKKLGNMYENPELISQ